MIKALSWICPECSSQNENNIVCPKKSTFVEDDLTKKRSNIDVKFHEWLSGKIMLFLFKFEFCWIC